MNGIIRKTAVVALISVPLSVVGIASADASVVKQKQKQTTRVTNTVSNSSSSTTVQSNSATTTNTIATSSSGGTTTGGASQSGLIGCQTQGGFILFCPVGFGF
jgi:hypothetical protein